jgi:hypothetical protein
MMDRVMDGMMGWGWLMMLLGVVLLVALIALVVMAIARISGRHAEVTRFVTGLHFIAIPR